MNLFVAYCKKNRRNKMKQFILCLCLVLFLASVSSLLAADKEKSMQGKVSGTDKSKPSAVQQNAPSNGTKAPIIIEKEPVKKGVFVEKEYVGYLSDAKSGLTGKTTNGINLFKQPNKHTSELMLVSGKSGYGIFLYDPIGKYVFHRFDAKGNEIVRKEILGTIKQKDNIVITARGFMNKEGTIAVSSIIVHKVKPQPIHVKKTGPGDDKKPNRGGK
jgi:hypothetical protein